MMPVTKQRLPLTYLDNQPDIGSSSLKELRDWIKGQPEVESSFIEDLKDDSRKGSTQLAEICIKKNEGLSKEKQRTASLQEIEAALHEQGYTHLAGVDEAGKGGAGWTGGRGGGNPACRHGIVGDR